MPGGPPPSVLGKRSKAHFQGMKIEIGPHIHAEGYFQGTKIEPGKSSFQGTKVNIGSTGKTALSHGEEKLIGFKGSEAEAVASSQPIYQQQTGVRITPTGETIRYFGDVGLIGFKGTTAEAGHWIRFFRRRGVI